MKFIRVTSVLFALTVLALPAFTAFAAIPLKRISRDVYTNPSSQHRTQVEPDSFSFGNTIVTVFQAGRFYDGGASNIGWSTSTDGGATWTNGFLPNTTTFAGGSYERISDPSVAYDAKHAVWIANTLGLASIGQSVLAHRSTDGGLTWGTPIVIDGPDSGFDKTWIACDNTAMSPYYGSCYAAWDDANAGGIVHTGISSDGGITWAVKTASGTAGLGVQPLALPDGTVVIPYYGFNGTMQVVRSTDGGASWSAPQTITSVHTHKVAGELRTEALPSAEMDGGGRVYLVWQDCRFIVNCKANDIVMTSSLDGAVWSVVKRIPLDKKSAGIDHFIPGIAANPNTSGNTAQLALAYYFYPDANCSVVTCKLNVAAATSQDGGATWSERTILARGMQLKWLPDTTLGYMVGDYISASFVNDKVFPVFSKAFEKKNRFRQATYTAEGGMTVLAGSIHTVDEPLEATGSGGVPRAPFVRQ